MTTGAEVTAAALFTQLFRAELVHSAPRLQTPSLVSFYTNLHAIRLHRPSALNGGKKEKKKRQHGDDARSTLVTRLLPGQCAGLRRIHNKAPCFNMSPYFRFNWACSGSERGHGWRRHLITRLRKQAFKNAITQRAFGDSSGRRERSILFLATLGHK